MRIWTACSLFIFAFVVGDARADEGMWTFHDFPTAKVKAKYNFTTDQAWLDHARLASARLAGICSASFVSANGLVMTNHHCAHDCVAGLSTKEHDYVKDGYWARTQDEEKKCPDLEVQRLDEITDVTDKVTKSTAGKTGAAYTAALREASAQIEKPCQTASDIRCELVNLYHGGQFMLYRYKRYTDVRVVGAPEFLIAFFGGDPDNFEFPRYDLDLSFVRVYENGKPAATPEHFTWSQKGPKDGELAFVSGNPGSTEREITTAMREFDRDIVAPLVIATRSELRGQLAQYMREGEEQKRTAMEWQFYNENSLKAWKGRMAALADNAMMKKMADAETDLRAKLASKPELAKQVGDAYQAIDKAFAMFKPHYHRFYAFERTSKGDLLGHAQHLVRGADERELPNGKRLDEFRDAQLPDIEQALQSPAPVYAGRDKLVLAFWLTKLREELGADDPTVRALLGKDAPEVVAARLVDTSKLGDPAERMRLWKGGRAAVAASKDPMIVFARAFDPAARKVRKMWDDEVNGVAKAAGEKIAKARFAIEGRSSYPDATFTPRLSYGAVKGYTSTVHGTKVAPFTTFKGAYERATGSDPFALPKTWLDAKKNVDPNVTLDLVTSNDIIGGNSGSPLFNQKLEIIGLVFDGNIESLAGDFWFDESNNRTVAVSSEGIIHALSRIYHMDRIVEELRPSKGKK